MVEEMAIKTRPHPAKFSKEIIPVLRTSLETWADRFPYGASVLDPFGGVGLIHEVFPDVPTLAIEIEREWWEQSAERGPSVCADFFEWEPDRRIGAVVTSCTYGNRMADHHQPAVSDTSYRATYRHALGRELSENNSGGMQWGPEYRAFHIKAWIRVREILAGGGVFVLNVKDHVRKDEVVAVADWHRDRVIKTGFKLLDDQQVKTRGMRFGANGQKRIDHERVMVFERVRDESRWNIEGRARAEAKRDAAVKRHGE